MIHNKSQWPHTEVWMAYGSPYEIPVHPKVDAALERSPRVGVLSPCKRGCRRFGCTEPQLTRSGGGGQIALSRRLD